MKTALLILVLALGGQCQAVEGSLDLGERSGNIRQFAERPPSITQHQLDKMVQKWQRVLLLGDWQIRARTVRLDEIPVGAAGFSQADRDLRYMTIAVLDPADYADLAELNGTIPRHGKEIIRDIEDTVVHELVHLRLRDLVQADSAGLRAAEEMTVNRITSALLRNGRWR